MSNKSTNVDGDMFNEVEKYLSGKLDRVFGIASNHPQNIKNETAA
ncbi:MAG: hypothetical protein Q8920_14580 [Bacillota bacterium]|nr:hypothetical protein [Bacillota bacterium]